MYCHMSPLERKIRTVLDSGFRIPDSFSVEIRFQISIASRILDSGSSIPDSKAQDSGFHKQNHPDSGIYVARHVSMSIRLTCWGKGERKTRTGKTAQGEKRPLSPPLPPSSPLQNLLSPNLSRGPDTRASDMLGYLTFFLHLMCLFID